MSPNPVNQPDGDLAEEIPETNPEAHEYLFDLGSMLNRVTADIIELGKLMNMKKNKEKGSISQNTMNSEDKEEVKTNIMSHEDNGMQ